MEKNSEKPNKFGSKKRGISVLPIVFSSVLAAGAIAGSAVSIWQVSKNYNASSEFSKSVKGRIKIDPNGTNDQTEAERTIKDCAEKLSRWLKDQGQKSYDVSYEIEHSDIAGEKEQYYGYLTAQFEVDKVLTKKPTSKEEEETKIDNDPYLSFFENKAFNTNEKTFVYRWYMENPGEGDRPVYSFIPFRQLFTLPNADVTDDPKAKPVTNEDGDNGVVFNVNNELLNDIYTDLAKAKKDSQAEQSNKTISAWNQPRIYIVNNLNGLYNEANYHLSFWWTGHDKPEYEKWYSGSDYSTFANNYKTKDFNGTNRDSSVVEQYFKLFSVNDKDGKKVENADIFNYVDQATVGTNEIPFTTKYIDKIITMDNFDKSMPKKIIDNYDNDVDEGNIHIRNFWYDAATKNDAKSYLRKQIIYGFNQATIVSVDTSKATSGEEVLVKTKQTLQETDIAPSFSETIFGGNSVVGVLSIGFLIFLIALLVILAVLYRTTGIISWICMFFALSITLLVATAASSAISMALILGMFALSLAGFIACINICGRLKRRLLSNEDTQLMIKKTFKKSLLPITDISVITLIFGVCFTYISPISLNALGVTLIIGAFAIFISIFLLNGLMHGLFFNNKIMVNRFSFFGKPSNVANQALLQSNNDIPTSLDATRLEFAYYSKMSAKKIDTTNRNTLIAVSVVGALLLVAIILFSVLGVANSSMFHTTNCLAIKSEQDVFAAGWVQGLNYVSYKHDLTSGWWYFYTNMSTNDLTNIAKAIPLTLGQDILIQFIVGSTNLDILNLSLIAIVVATLCCAVYSIIRYNWIAFVPMFAGAFAMPLIFLGLSAMFQIKFDEYVILGFALVVVFNTIVSADIIGSINEAWSRRDAYNKVEFKYIVNTALKNNWTFIWTIAVSYLLFLVIFAITSPTSTNYGSMIGILIIGGILTQLIVPFTLSFLLYQFMKIRNVVLNKIVERNKNKVVINYDDIDEQGIEGINKFTRHIPIAQEQKPEVK